MTRKGDSINPKAEIVMALITVQLIPNAFLVGLLLIIARVVWRRKDRVKHRRRVGVLAGALLLSSGCQTTAASTQLYGGKSIETCPGDAPTDGIHAAGTDLSADLAEERAKGAFASAYAVPSDLEVALKPALLAICTDGDNRFTVTVGLERDALLKRQGALQSKLNAPTTAGGDRIRAISESLLLAAEVRQWESARAFLDKVGLTVPAVDATKFDNRLQSAKSGLRLAFAPEGEIDPTLLSGLASAALKSGFTTTSVAGGAPAPDLTVHVTVRSDALARAEGGLQFVRLTALLSATRPNGEGFSESRLAVKGGGTDVAAATMDARDKLTREVAGRFLETVFASGGAP